jgi:predicted Zn-dependent protease
MTSARPASPRPLSRRIARTTGALAISTALVFGDFMGASHAVAQSNGNGGKVSLPIIRDAETEELLRDYTRPILKAAGLQNQKIEVVIINDRQFNAFVADGRRIFVNLGALVDSKTPNQIIGVLAHETGHIAGGHLARRREQLANMQTMAILAMLAGGAAMVAGARGNGNMSQAAPGILMAPQSMLQRTLLSYVRTQEESADRAGVKFLEATGQSPRGMVETFQRFANDTMFIQDQIDPYLQSHPMPRERIMNLEHLAQKSPYFNKKDPPELQLRHDMMRAKLFAFSDPAGTTMRRYPTSDTSLPARYARAIATYRFGDLRSALSQIDALMQVQPRNPYLYELWGQALLEAGKPRDAIPALRKAVELSKGSPLIRILLGQAMVQTNDKSLTDEAIRELHIALEREPTASLGYRQLAIAYARKGDKPNAALASAQDAFNSGDIPTARQLALRAQKAFPAGSSGWIKSDDIVNYKPRKL